MTTNQQPLFNSEKSSAEDIDSPRRRVLRDGADACNTHELLSALVAGRDGERVARALLSRYGSVARISRATAVELAAECGIGVATAVRVHAALSLARRLHAPETEHPLVRTPSQAAQLLMPLMGTLEQEEVHTALLDARGRLIAVRMIYRGSLNACAMRMGEVYREAIRHNAASIIVAHNHPSGDPSPSADDVRVTRQLCEASKLLDIELVDHIIVAANRFVSLKERGLGFE